MKHLLIILAITILTTQFYTPVVRNDYISHFAVGYTSAHLAYTVFPKITNNKKVIKYGPLIFCVALGVAKELSDKYDSNPKTTFEWEDIALTTGGSITLLTIEINKIK